MGFQSASLRLTSRWQPGLSQITFLQITTATTVPLLVSNKSSLVLLGPFNPTGAKTVHQWPIQITSLGNSGGSDAGHGGGDGDGDDLADREGHASNLGDEDGGHGLVQRGAVHVDGGTDGEHEPVVRKEDTNF